MPGERETRADKCDMIYGFLLQAKIVGCLLGCDCINNSVAAAAGDYHFNDLIFK